MINEKESYLKNDIMADNDGSYDDYLFDFSEPFDANQKIIDKLIVDDNAIQSKSSKNHIIQDVCESSNLQFNPLLAIHKTNLEDKNQNQEFQHFPYFLINIPNKSNFQIYYYLYQLTGAYLTQKELIYLRKSIFSNVLPTMLREEQRSKIKNIQCIEKFKKQLIPILQIPSVQYSIQSYIFTRRNKSQKYDMLYNIHNQFSNVKNV